MTLRFSFRLIPAGFGFPRYTCAPMHSKVYDSPTAALHGLARNGITVAVGGFGLCGIPEQLIIALRDSGKAVLLVSVELDEIMSLSDRVLVMFDGQIMGERLPTQTNER